MQNMNASRQRTAPLQFDFGKPEQMQQQAKPMAGIAGMTGQAKQNGDFSREDGMDSNYPASQSHSMPIKSFRSGAIQVSIWENETLGQDNLPKTYKTVSFERRYKDKSGAWKSTNSLRVNDLPKAALIMSKAYEYLILTESSDDENQ